MIGTARRIVELGGELAPLRGRPGKIENVLLTCSEFDLCRARMGGLRTAPRAKHSVRQRAGRRRTTAPSTCSSRSKWSSMLPTTADSCEPARARSQGADHDAEQTAKRRTPPPTGPPPYYQHVREWTAGEFYWVLRLFYERVTLFAMPDPKCPGPSA